MIKSLTVVYITFFICWSFFIKAQNYQLRAGCAYSGNYRLFEKELFPVPYLFTQTKLKNGYGFEVNGELFMSDKWAFKFGGAGFWYNVQYPEVLIGPDELEAVRINEKLLINVFGLGIANRIINQTNVKLDVSLNFDYNDLKFYNVSLSIVSTNKDGVLRERGNEISSKISSRLEITPTFIFWNNQKTDSNAFVFGSVSFSYGLNKTYVGWPFLTAIIGIGYSFNN